MGLSHNVEVVGTTTVNMFDSPMEVLQACFPNEKAPKIRLHDIYITYAKTYIDKPHKLSIEEIIDRVSKKARKSTAEIDLEIKWLIETEFEAEVEYKTILSNSIIDSIPTEKRMDVEYVKSLLAVVDDEVEFVKTSSHDLSDKVLYDNKLIRGVK